jgi:Ni/Fe-hydrogenase subunit HybB-like protein
MHMPLMSNIARVLAVLVAFYLMLRLGDLRGRQILELIFIPRTETYLWWLEIGLFAIGSILLFQRRIRASADGLYIAALFVIFGFVTNRLNISLTGMMAASGTNYIPKWTEIMITLSVIAVGFAVFRTAVKYLPVFEDSQEEEPAEHEEEEIEINDLVLTR